MQSPVLLICPHTLHRQSSPKQYCPKAIWSKQLLKSCPNVPLPFLKETQSLERHTYSEMAFMWSYHCLIHPTSYLNRQKPLSRQFVVDSNGNCAHCGLYQNFSPLGYVSVILCVDQWRESIQIHFALKLTIVVLIIKRSPLGPTYCPPSPLIQ